MKTKILVGGKELQMELSSGPVIMGRDAHCAVQILDPHVSRSHALLYEENDKIYLKDLGSTNGTFYVKDRLPSTASVQIERDSEFRLAGVSVRIQPAT